LLATNHGSPSLSITKLLLIALTPFVVVLTAAATTIGLVPKSG
jgi:hypothetical protein